MEVPQGSPQVIIDPEAPLAILAAAKKHSPSASGLDFKTMLFITFGIPNGRSLDIPTATGGMVGVATLKEKG